MVDRRAASYHAQRRSSGIKWRRLSNSGVRRNSSRGPGPWRTVVRSVSGATFPSTARASAMMVHHKNLGWPPSDRHLVKVLRQRALDVFFQRPKSKSLAALAPRYVCGTVRLVNAHGGFDNRHFMLPSGQTAQQWARIR